MEQMAELDGFLRVKGRDSRRFPRFLMGGGVRDWDGKHRGKEFVQVCHDSRLDVLSLWILGGLQLPVQGLLCIDVDSELPEAHTNFWQRL